MNEQQMSFGLALLVACLSSCQSTKSEQSKEPAQTTQAEALLQVPEEEAKPLIEAFQRELQGKLSAALAEGGPPAAIDVCAKQAPLIAEHAGNSRYVVRRIGTRTRNAEKNRSSPVDLEALQHLSQKPPTHHAAGAFYQAIFAQPMCLTCHGDRANLQPDVLAALQRLYPNDGAVGYQQGDLRGAFVVEPR